jgi:hypothetical protein
MYYLHFMSNRMTGFANVTTQTLIVHLLALNVLITHTHIAINEKR